MKNIWLAIGAAIIVAVVAIAILVTQLSPQSITPTPPPTTPPTSPATPSVTVPQEIKLSVVSGSIGGSFYLSTSAILAAIGPVEGIILIHQAGGGSAVQLPMLLEGKIDITAGSLADAKALWDQGKRDLRIFLPVGIFAMQVVTRADAPINKWSDLDKKAVSIGSPGFIANAMARMLFKELGISPSKIIELGHRDSMDQLIIGSIDAYIFTGLPNPTVAEYAVKHSLKIVPPASDEIEKIKKVAGKYGYVVTHIDLRGEKFYKGVDVEFDTLADFGLLFTTPRLPQDIGYKLVKNYWENKKIAAQLYVQHDWFKPQDLIEASLSTGIPLHAGVVQYFKEKGIQLPPEVIPPEYKE